MTDYVIGEYGQPESSILSTFESPTGDAYIGKLATTGTWPSSVFEDYDWKTSTSSLTPTLNLLCAGELAFGAGGVYYVNGQYDAELYQTKAQLAVPKPSGTVKAACDKFFK